MTKCKLVIFTHPGDIFLPSLTLGHKARKKPSVVLLFQNHHQVLYCLPKGYQTWATYNLVGKLLDEVEKITKGFQALHTAASWPFCMWLPSTYILLFVYIYVYRYRYRYT
jgi:hypothetical protein